MVTIHLKGQVTEDGKLLFDVPENLPPGDVAITIEIPSLVGGWEDKGITDPVAWVEELRRKQREKRIW